MAISCPKTRAADTKITPTFLKFPFQICNAIKVPVEYGLVVNKITKKLFTRITGPEVGDGKVRSAGKVEDVGVRRSRPTESLSCF